MEQIKLKETYDFNELHNSKHVIAEIKNNEEIQNQLNKSKELINKYLIDFAKSFIFNIATVDVYLSDSDVKIICENDKYLKNHYSKGMQLSEVITLFKNSDFCKNIPFCYDSDSEKSEYPENENHYKFDEYFLDVTNKKIYFCNSKNIWVSIQNNKTQISIELWNKYNYTWYGHSRDSGRVYPTYNRDTNNYTIIELIVDIQTNQIIKTETE